MFLATLRKRVSRPVSARRRIAIRKAIRTLPIVEGLDNRTLLSGKTYNVPLTDGGNAVTDVFLSPHFGTNEVDVTLNSRTAPVVATLIFEFDSNTAPGLTLHDFVPAAAKAGGAIFFDTSADGTLEVNAGDNEKQINVDNSTFATTGTVTTTDSDPENGGSGTDAFGAGVRNVKVIAPATGRATIQVGSGGDATTPAGVKLTIDTGTSVREEKVSGTFSDVSEKGS